MEQRTTIVHNEYTIMTRGITILTDDIVQSDIKLMLKSGDVPDQRRRDNPIIRPIR